MEPVGCILHRLGYYQLYYKSSFFLLCYHIWRKMIVLYVELTAHGRPLTRLQMSRHYSQRRFRLRSNVCFDLLCVCFFCQENLHRISKTSKKFDSFPKCRASMLKIASISTYIYAFHLLNNDIIKWNNG